VASLYTDLKDVPAGALSVDLMLRLAQDAQNALAIVKGTLRPVTEAQAAEIQRWADASTASIDALGGALSLRQAFADAAGAPDPTVEQLLGLADTNRRALQVLDTVLIPITETQAELYGTYADTVGSASAAFQAALGFSAGLFADYRSPSDAQLNMIVTDAGRLVDSVADAAAIYDTAGLEAARQFGDTTGAIVGAFDQMLVLTDRINNTEMGIDAAQLGAFKENGLQLLDVAAALSGRAATIPAGDLAALSNTSAAITGFSDAMIGLNAVPQMPNLGALGGGGQSITIAPGAIVIHAAPGMDVQALGNEVMRQFTARTNSRR
jgi:hypothetical protein